MTQFSIGNTSPDYRKFITWFLIHKFPDPWHWMKNCLNSGLNESSGLVEWYIHENSQAKKLKTTRYNTAELIQPRPNMAMPRHRDTACQQGVNRKCITWLPISYSQSVLIFAVLFKKGDVFKRFMSSILVFFCSSEWWQSSLFHFLCVCVCVWLVCYILFALYGGHLGFQDKQLVTHNS